MPESGSGRHRCQCEAVEHHELEEMPGICGEYQHGAKKKPEVFVFKAVFFSEEYFGFQKCSPFPSKRCSPFGKMLVL